MLLVYRHNLMISKIYNYVVSKCKNIYYYYFEEKNPDFFITYPPPQQQQYYHI